MGEKLKLLPEPLLCKTNNVDHADWNYRPLLGFIQRERFKLVRSLMGKKTYNDLLEIGYGSGVFMPVLAKYCKKLYGIDLHPFKDKVSNILMSYGIPNNLSTGSVSKMPYANDSFDLIVSVSVFEFIEDKETACSEIVRVLKKDGKFIMVTPGVSPLLDLGLKILTRKSAKEDYGNRREQVMPVINEYFSVFEMKVFPTLFRHPIYRGYILTPLNKSA